MIYDLQKASLGKRISAFLFDFIILSVLAVGIAVMMSWATGYNSHMNDIEGYYKQYEEKYGIDLNISREDYNKLTQEQKDVYKQADEEFKKDADVGRTYSMIFNLTLVIISVSILLAFLILEFAVPLFLHNGQTFGKKIFSVAVMMVNGVKISNVALFVRTVLGKYTIETMIPLLLIMMIFFGVMGYIGTIVIGLLLLLQIGLMIFTSTNSMIHDVLSSTVTVDMESQKIFESYDDMVAFKAEIQKEKAQRADY